MAGFIFDMDGTLMNSIGIWHEAELKVMADAGMELSKSDRDELNALTLEEAGDFFHDRFGVLGSGREVIDAITAHMLEFYRNDAAANPGTIDFVRAVHAAGVPMCVLSSSPQEFLKAGLPCAGFGGFFADDLIISAEDLGMTKRAPETFSHVCGLLGTAPADTWLFDDSWYALATAHTMGLRCVGVFSTDNCGSHEELARYSEIVVDDFTELDPASFL